MVHPDAIHVDGSLGFEVFSACGMVMLAMFQSVPGPFIIYHCTV